jgi:hypothetical protein
MVSPGCKTGHIRRKLSFGLYGIKNANHILIISAGNAVKTGFLGRIHGNAYHLARNKFELACEKSAGKHRALCRCLKVSFVVKAFSRWIFFLFQQKKRPESLTVPAYFIKFICVKDFDVIATQLNELFHF